MSVANKLIATKTKRLGVLILSLSLTGGILAAQSGGESAPAPAPVNVEAPSVSSVGNGALPQAIDPLSYVIGAQDILRVEVWREEAFSRTTAVRPDGKISIPLLGDLQAENLTPERLAAQLEQALATFIQMPEVTVDVMQVNSKFYSVAGMAGRPGKYPMPTPVTVFEAINNAGGFQLFANHKVLIMRGDERLEFNYDDYVKGKNVDKNPNLLLETGDTVFIR